MERQSWDTISFGGEETLCLAKFAKNVIDDSSLYTPYIVHIKGHYVMNKSEASVLGKLKILNSSDEYINGYIRNIRVEDIHSKKRKKGLSVGCSNATLEDIAADKVTFFFFGKPGNRHTLIRDRHYICYAVRPPPKYITKRKMKELENSKDYLKTIAVAKRLGNAEDKESRHKAKELLIRYLGLEDPEFDADMKEMTAEAFRSLEELCQIDPKSSWQATEVLSGYIERSINIPAYRNSVIYAIEALGFVANHNEDSKAQVCTYLSDLLNRCDRNNFRDNPTMYWHIVWASLVTLNRTMHENLETAPIFEINRSLLDKSVLAEIKPKETRSVIQKALAEVIINSRVMTPDVYLSTFGLDGVDLRDLQNAAREDRVTETKRLGNHSRNWIELVIPKLRTEAGNLSRAMAYTILVGVARAYLGLP